MFVQIYFLQHVLIFTHIVKILYHFESVEEGTPYDIKISDRKHFRRFIWNLFYKANIGDFYVCAYVYAQQFQSHVYMYIGKDTRVQKFICSKS